MTPAFSGSGDRPFAIVEILLANVGGIDLWKTNGQLVNNGLNTR